VMLMLACLASANDKKLIKQAWMEFTDKKK
jgi:hypothetical protein